MAMTDDEHILETGRLAELGLQASSLVHELRQPVFAIKALGQLLITRLAGRDEAQLAALLQQVETLETLLERYGDSSRRPTGEFQPTDLGDAVTVGTESVIVHRTDIEVEIHALAGQSWVHADPVAVRQITSNLVRNAVDAARSLVTVRIHDATLTVLDDGGGILAEIEPRLGEPFVTSKPPGEGTGLGLVVTRKLVDSVGGELSWQTSDRGTCFTVRFTPFGDAHDD
jgi:two-component system C4-dicarboxylate transport sensor histidine kinase DctB